MLESELVSLPQIHNRPPKDARMINLQIRFSLRNSHLMKYSFLFNEINVRGIIMFTVQENRFV